MPTVKETFEAMAGRFRADKSSGTNAVIQYDEVLKQDGAKK